MTRKYFNKETVTYKFKLDVLRKDDNEAASVAEKKLLWRAYLIIMSQQKLIGRNSAKTWTYPTKILNN